MLIYSNMKRIYLESDTMSEILLMKDNLEHWWYKWEIIVIMTPWLDKNIKKSGIEFEVKQFYWMRVIPYLLKANYEHNI